MSKIIPVILCGGSGSRLWPLSRMDVPKQFLKLLDNHTLLQKTALRALNVAQTNSFDLVVVTLSSMKPETARQLEEVSPMLTRHILAEPQARNTAAAVAYATAYVQKHFGEDATIWILPADHYVGDEDALGAAVQNAAAVAEDGYLVTFGIPPTRPETGYGYIRKAEPLAETGAYKVDAFLEKPNLDIAQAFVDSGQYLWSSGMHVFKVATAIENFQLHAPLIWETVAQSLAEGQDDQNPSLETYRLAKEEPFETAVIERAEKIAVIPCDPQWSDIGSWASIWEINPKNEKGNALKGKVVCEETENSMILAQDRLVTCVGLKDIIVIETADSVLVADKSCNSSLKALVKRLQMSGHKEIRSMNAPVPAEVPALPPVQIQPLQATL